MSKRASTYILSSTPTKTLISLAVTLFALVLFCAAVPPAPAQPAGEPEPGASYSTLLARADRDGGVRVIVELDVDALSTTAWSNPALMSSHRTRIRSARTRLLDRLAGHFVRLHRTYDQLPYVALTLDGDALEATAADPEVIAIHEDRLLKSTLADSTVLIGATHAAASGYDGAGQTVAILDTGVDARHPFVAGRVVYQACFSSNEPAFGISTLCPNGATRQIGGNAGRPCAVSGCAHGTHMAGTAAGDGAGFSGVAPEARILSIQVFQQLPWWWCDGDERELRIPCIGSSTADLMAALEHVYHLRSAFNIAAVNLSLGDGLPYTAPCDSDPLRGYIDLLRANGIATVVSAGNEYYPDAISSPACISSAISVGSTTKWDRVKSYSNSAWMLDLLAPGSDIYSSVPGGGFATFEGTSCAVAHVTGAFAVVRSAVPGASIDEILRALRREGERIRDPKNGLTRSRIQVDLAAEALVNFKTPPTIDSLRPDVSAPQLPFTTINFTANASGGTGKYDYRWWLFDGTSWQTVRKWKQGRDTFAWTPTSPNPDYKIVVWARNTGQTTGKPRGKAAIEYPIELAPPPDIESLTADRAAPQVTNMRITFTAKASGGTGKYEYRWWVVKGATWKSAGQWKPGRDTFSWTPTSPSPDYKIVVWVRNAGQTTGKPRNKAAMTYPIKPVLPPDIVSLTADRTAPQLVNTPITFTAKVSGGTGKYDCRWWVVNGNTWNPVVKWKEGANQFSWKPASPSPYYKIVVWARNAGQTTGKPRGKASMTYPINAR